MVPAHDPAAHAVSAADKVRCRRCGQEILAATAARYRGKCRGCSTKKWHDPVREASALVIALVVSPFVMGGLGIAQLWRYVSRHIPGTREHLKARLQRGWNPDWATVQHVWSNARCVYEGPVGFSAEMTAEALLLEALIRNRAIPSAELLIAISDRNPVLSAYCVIALEWRGDAGILTSLPIDVRESSKPIQYRSGCFVTELSLGRLVSRHITAR